MDVQAAVAGVKQHFEAFVASAKEKLEQELPVLDHVLAAAAPVVQAFGAATHLPEVPEAVQMVAEYIQKLDAALAAAKAAGAAEAAQAQADAAAAAAAAQPAA
ncbi:MAG TPA: hypothetical protein VN714_14960 [Trebonia sp.]|nr:hypothetical protein [Trebonia sp.]